MSFLKNKFQCKTTLENSQESLAVRNAKVTFWVEKTEKETNKHCRNSVRPETNLLILKLKQKAS